jgi:hypothetical protein
MGVSADRCPARGATEIKSLSGLPTPLRALLPPTGHGLDDIADRGGRFNATDVVIHTLPRRRFTLAAVSGDCAVIAIEYGGIAQGFEIVEYHLAQGVWSVTNRTSASREPKTVMDLLGTR